MDSIEDALKHQQIRDAGFTDTEIAMFGLMDKSEDEICSYLSTHVLFRKIIPVQCSELRRILADKIASQHYLNSVGAKTPTLVGVWDPVFGMTGDGRPMTTVKQFKSEIQSVLSDEDKIDLIFKPRDGGSGQYIVAGSFVKTSDGDIAALIGGQPQSVDAFIAKLPEDPHSILSGEASLGWVVQVKVEQHPEIAKFNASSLNTLRIGTFITKPQGKGVEKSEVILDYACFRVGREGANSDNMSTGGLSIDVDLETGCLKRGRFALEYGAAYADEHPDSKLHFVGLKLPLWEEAATLCLRIAKTLPSVRTVGWDVAITEGGPLIIEGNCPWGTRAPQSYDVGYLTPARRAMYEASGDPLPATTLPPTRALPGMSKQSWALYKLRKKIGI
ncbi:hypothetical protein ROA7450_02639 [Roseovarius albus]|uniref:Alpha-L-glutamate ligase-related protein ATP-grasp domain-containing protein n=1 Tax=Roseovarius albus TaxID=1247867 RepID=A0A1X6ZJ39_9RHOB|nr:sugar-transfer associated ATP-grasp domain-containing protein [Roseovarius albus]SLN52500.1 hypothetical protein ROA7450_02639 [Roseovarius albus]